MAKTDYIRRVNEYMLPYLDRNGYKLIKTEFVNEDGNFFLRLYIDLSPEEYAKRADKLNSDSAGETETDSDDRLITDSVEETKTDSDAQSAPDASASDYAADDEEETPTPSVSINDCVKVSRFLSKWLDKEDFIKETYTMEVCSKGFLADSTSEDKQGEGK